jgi:hypothetical protein
MSWFVVHKPRDANTGENRGIKNHGMGRLFDTAAQKRPIAM